MSDQPPTVLGISRTPTVSPEPDDPPPNARPSEEMQRPEASVVDESLPALHTDLGASLIYDSTEFRHRMPPREHNTYTARANEALGDIDNDYRAISDPVQRTRNFLKTYRDKSKLMAIAMNHCSTYWNRFHLLLSLPLMMLQSLGIVLNSGAAFSADAMKYPNAVLNLLTAVIIAVVNFLRTSEKTEAFSGHQRKFNALYGEILEMLAQEEPATPQDARKLTERYGLYMAEISNPVPRDVKKKMKLFAQQTKIDSIPNILTSIDDLEPIEPVP